MDSLCNTETPDLLLTNTSLLHYLLKNWANNPHPLFLFHILDAACQIPEQVTEFLTTGLKIHQLISMAITNYLLPLFRILKFNHLINTNTYLKPHMRDINLHNMCPRLE